MPEELIAGRVHEESTFSSPSPDRTEVTPKHSDPDWRPNAIRTDAAAEPSIPLVVPSHEGQVQVGDRKALVQTAVGLDRNGRRVMLNVNIPARRTCAHKLPTRSLSPGTSPVGSSLARMEEK